MYVIAATRKQCRDLEVMIYDLTQFSLSELGIAVITASPFIARYLRAIDKDCEIFWDHHAIEVHKPRLNTSCTMFDVPMPPEKSMIKICGTCRDWPTPLTQDRMGKCKHVGAVMCIDEQLRCWIGRACETIVD